MQQHGRRYRGGRRRARGRQATRTGAAGATSEHDRQGGASIFQLAEPATVDFKNFAVKLTGAQSSVSESSVASVNVGLSHSAPGMANASSSVDAVCHHVIFNRWPE